MDTVDKLKEHSEIVAKLYFESGLFSGYRYVIYGNYLAFYRVVGQAVYIDRIIYDKLDYMSILFGN